MSQPEIIHFPNRHALTRDHNPEAANSARERIANLPNPYLDHAMPSKEALVGDHDPVSPAAITKPRAGSAPFRIGGAAGAEVEHKHHHKKKAAHHLPSGHKEKAPEVPAIPVAASTPIAASTATPIAETPPHLPANPLASSADTLPAREVRGAPKPKSTDETRSLPSRFRPLIVGVVTFVLLFLVFKSPIFISQLSYLVHGKNNASTNAPAVASTAVSPDPVITIPKINVNAPVVYAADNAEAAIQKDLESGVVHYANTAQPGTNGNSVIFGHSSNDWWEPGNYKFVFVLLDKLVVGDTFTVNYNSKHYVYQVTETKVVEPTDLSVLNQTADPQMTLITCTPPGTSWKRLIIRSKQISPAPDTAVDASPAPATTQTQLPGNSKGVGGVFSGWWHGLTGFFGGGDDDNRGGDDTPSNSSTPTTLPGGK